MTNYVHLDGEIVSSSDACVNVRDRGFLYGDGIFETLRAYDGGIFAWESHWERLQHGCEQIQLDHGLSRSEVRTRIAETLKANDLTDAYVRVSITRGQQPGLLTPDQSVDPTVVVIAKALPRGGVHGEAVWDGPATCSIADVEHVPAAALPADLKSHNYLNGILAKLNARSNEADEALLLDADGCLTEGTTTNLFFVQDGGLCTPSDEKHPLLPGITRRVVLELADKANIPVRTGTWTPAELQAADEVFLTNTTWEVRPVTAVDDGTYSVGPITTDLARAYDERVESRHYVD